MTATTKLLIPIWTRTGRFTSKVFHVATEVPLLSRDEAPVVLTWTGIDLYRIENRVTKRHDYRLYDGVLWAYAGSRKDYDEKELQQLAYRALGSGMLQMPAFANATTPAQQTQIDDIGSDTLIESRIRAVAPEFDRRVIVIENEVWLRSYGPLLRSMWNDHILRNPRLVHTTGREDIIVPDRQIFAFPAAERVRIEEFMAECYGNRARIVGAPVEVVGEWPRHENDEIIDLTTERAIWHFLWEARFYGVDQSIYNTKSYDPHLGVRIADLVIRGREALQSRWPGIDLDKVPTTHAMLAPHLYGRKLPDASGLIPLLTEIINIPPEVFGENLNRNWTMVLRRAQEKEMEQELSQEGIEALEGLVL